MIFRQNLHTHSTYCDGNDSLRDIIEAAIKAGLESIGFSAHSYTGLSFDESAIKRDSIRSYISELDTLKAEYRDRIRIYTGFEYDSRAIDEAEDQYDKSSIDYSIGSVHILHYSGHYFIADYSKKALSDAIDFFGSERNMVLNFFEEVVRFAYMSDYDIVGHFDLIEKFSEQGGISFSEKPWYRKMATEAIDAVASRGKIFEVNTGAMARGYRTQPYPADFLLHHLKDSGAHITISSDCHNRNNITYGFEMAENLLRRIGFTELYELTDNGFIPCRL